MVPNLGCAQATCQTGPSCLEQGNTKLWESFVGFRAGPLVQVAALHTPFEVSNLLALPALDDVIHLYSPVRRARRQAFAIVVQLHIVLCAGGKAAREGARTAARPSAAA